MEEGQRGFLQASIGVLALADLDCVLGTTKFGAGHKKLDDFSPILLNFFHSALELCVLSYSCLPKHFYVFSRKCIVWLINKIELNQPSTTETVASRISGQVLQALLASWRPKLVANKCIVLQDTRTMIVRVRLVCHGFPNWSKSSGQGGRASGRGVVSLPELQVAAERPRAWL